MAKEARTSAQVVVRVQDTVAPRLTGHGGASYESPPQTPAQARMLVRLLLGWAPEADDGHTRWQRAIAGGMRTVTLSAVTQYDCAEEQQAVRQTTP